MPLQRVLARTHCGVRSQDKISHTAARTWHMAVERDHEAHCSIGISPFLLARLLPSVLADATFRGLEG